EVVVAARREAEGDHRDLRVDSLDRVVTGGHRLLLHVPGDTLAAVVELWLVKARLVAFVEADHLAHVRVALHDLRRVLGEELDAVRRVDEDRKSTRLNSS